MLTIDDVKKFHEAFGHPAKDTSEYLKHFEMEGFDTEEAALRRLRTDLISEEADELLQACRTRDPVEYADALFDLLYVTYGAILALGVPQSIGDEVQRSNMSKLGKDGKPIYRGDGKILKGPNFSPPDIASILERECK